ncbi:MAG: phage tail assembly chaperone, partial [Planctomycetota bacterium]
LARALDWHLRYDEDAIEALQRRELKNATISETLLDEPTVTYSQQWLWDAFQEISSRRPIGMGIEKIKHTEVLAYAELQGLDEDERWHLYRVVIEMDDVLVAFHSEKKDSG